MSELPEALRREVEDLPRHYRVRHGSARGRVVLTAEVRSVPVTLSLDTARYPFEPPEIELGSGWTWEKAGGRKIRCLRSQERWNRTLGLAVLLRELRQCFRETPPRRSRLREGGARVGRSLFAFLFGWIGRLRERLRRRAPETELPVEASAAAVSEADALRARYDRIVQEQTARVHRYQLAVADLMEQWRAKSARLDDLRAEVGRLETREAEALEAAREIVDELQGSGTSTAGIKADSRYRRAQAAYEGTTVQLGELRDRVAGLEADAERHLAKVRRHEVQLEDLMDELENLKHEAAEVVTDMTLVEVEREIVDIRAGLKASGAAEELERLRRRLRQEQARVRLTREATDVGGEVDDDLYLEVADKASAARDFEASLGLGEPGRVGEKVAE